MDRQRKESVKQPKNCDLVIGNKTDIFGGSMIENFQKKD
jgi:hypothetical protein